MKISKRFILILILLPLLSVSSWAAECISDYTKQAVLDFMTTRVRLKSEADDKAVEAFNSIREDLLKNLPANAKDLEQERCIIESMCFMEIYEHSLSEEKRASLRKTMKTLMDRNIECMNSRPEENISSWLYLVSGDVTAYYMTRSVAATFLYGFKIKNWYEKGSVKDGGNTGACVSLGNWLFYAPIPFGSNKRAESLYKRAVQISKSAGELYQAYEHLSQLYFEQKKFDLSDFYLQKAYELNLGTKELDLIKTCNKAGYSLFQYYRNRSGIDLEIPENEKEEADR